MEDSYHQAPLPSHTVSLLVYEYAYYSAVVRTMRGTIKKTSENNALYIHKHFFYLTTALTYGELLFSCAFGDGPIEVTV